MVKQISKRDGSIVAFDPEKIRNVIWKAVQAVGGKDKEESDQTAELAIKLIHEKFGETGIPTVEDVQDIVEKALIEKGHAMTAKAYILYRHKKSVEREVKGLMGVKDDLKLSLNAIQVLERRYLLKDENGKIIETPSQLFRRVAKFIASGEKLFGGDEETVSDFESAFYEIMSKLEFLPNSPTLMNAGTEIGQLSACFVLGVGDDLDGIFESVKDTALIHKSGGGTGFSFSYLRPKGDFVKSTAGVASGPISFMTIFDVATNVVKQGGKRRGANMGVMEAWHPDVEEFIAAKQTPGVLENFNISVGLDDRFMHAVESDGEYEYINPRTGQVLKKIRARNLFSLISYSAWKSAEPGILFMDTINRENPTPKYRIMATNPCGEVPMPNYESCNLASINVAKFVELDWSKTDWKKKIDWKHLRYVVRLGTQFLDNVIELNKYPIEKIKEQSRLHRRIGLGVMGFARMLYKMGVSYDSELAYEIGEYLMKFITDEARKMSHELGRARGSFPGFKDSVWASKYDAMRNATVTSIAPTGTISMIADTSSGVEPMFSLAYVKIVMDGARLYYSEETFEHVLKVRGLFTPDLMQKVIETGSIAGFEELPKEILNIFRVAYDIKAEAHVRMQAAFQKYTDLAVSKTINMPAEATVEDVQNAYMLAWKLGCKGVTVYRDGSRGEGVLAKIKPAPKPVEPQPQEPPGPINTGGQ